MVSEAILAWPAPRQVAITPDGAKLVLIVANDSSLLILTTDPLVVVQCVPLPQWPQDVIVTPDGSQAIAFIASPDTALVVVTYKLAKRSSA